MWSYSSLTGYTPHFRLAYSYCPMSESTVVLYTGIAMLVLIPTENQIIGFSSLYSSKLHKSMLFISAHMHSALEGIFFTNSRNSCNAQKSALVLVFEMLYITVILQ